MVMKVTPNFDIIKQRVPKLVAIVPIGNDYITYWSDDTMREVSTMEQRICATYESQAAYLIPEIRKQNEDLFLQGKIIKY